MTDLELFYSVYALYLWMGLTALVLVLAIWLAIVQLRVKSAIRHYQRLTAGTDSGNLEDALDSQMNLLEDLAARMDLLEAFCQELDVGLQRAIQKVGVTRFSPFSDTGGDQSFCVALLDSLDDGLVLSSLFSRAETRVFAKPIQRGHSRYALTDEEVKTLELAGASEINAKAKQTGS